MIVGTYWSFVRFSFRRSNLLVSVSVRPRCLRIRQSPCSFYTLAGIRLPLLAGIRLPLFAGIRLPLLAGIRLPLLAGIRLPYIFSSGIRLLLSCCDSCTTTVLFWLPASLSILLILWFSSSSSLGMHRRC